MLAEMKGLSAEDVATLSGIAEEYNVSFAELAAAWLATQAWIDEVRALFAERRCAWPRTSWQWSSNGSDVSGFVLHYFVSYERPELLDDTLTEMSAIPALPRCPVKTGGDAA